MGLDKALDIIIIRLEKVITDWIISAIQILAIVSSVLL